MLNLLSPTGSDVLGHFESRLGLEPAEFTLGNTTRVVQWYSSTVKSDMSVAARHISQKRVYSISEKVYDD